MPKTSYDDKTTAQWMHTHESIRIKANHPTPTPGENKKVISDEPAIRSYGHSKKHKIIKDPENDKKKVSVEFIM